MPADPGRSVELTQSPRGVRGMNPAIVVAVAITALAVFLFFTEGDRLARGHVRARTQILNTVRWAIVIALSWALIPTALAEPSDQRAETVIGLAVLIGATILIPVRWFIRIGGREPTWELRRAKIEVALLANRVRRGTGKISPSRLRETVDRIALIKTPQTAELCDLLTAQLKDLIAGHESWNEAGRRSIRIDELSRELWPGAMPAPDFASAEATFRWHLYRHFGAMMELSADGPGGSSLREFRNLMEGLEEFRRPDTYRFLDAVCQSAYRWLGHLMKGKPWIATYDFVALGPDGLAEISLLWGRDASMWGAHLDEDDRRALEEDLDRRAEAAKPEPGVIAPAGCPPRPSDPA